MAVRRAQSGDGLPPPPWARAPQRPVRRRRDPLTQEAVVEAALRVLDEDGLDQLSMRHVARTLDATAAALYWHVGSKDGLLDLVMDQVIGEQRVPDPEPGRWPEQLRELARQQREICLRHPWIVEVSIGRIPMGPNALNYSERVLAILTSGGVPDTLAVQGYLLMISTVDNGLSLANVTPYAGQVFHAGLLLLALVIDGPRRPTRARRPGRGPDPLRQRRPVADH